MASRASLGTVAASVPPLVSKHLLTPFRGWLSAFCRSGLGVAWPVVGFRTEAPAWNCMVPSLIAACDVNCWQDRCHCLDLFGSKTLNSLAEAKHPCCWCLRQMGRSDNTGPIVLGRFIALAGTAAAGALCCRRFGEEAEFWPVVKMQKAPDDLGLHEVICQKAPPPKRAGCFELFGKIERYASKFSEIGSGLKGHILCTAILRREESGKFDLSPGDI